MISSQWRSCGVSSAGKSLREHPTVSREKAEQAVDEARYTVRVAREKGASIRRKLQILQDMLRDPNLEKSVRSKTRHEASRAQSDLDDCMTSIHVAEEQLLEALETLERARLRDN